MKKLWRRFRDWMIVRLGGATAKHRDDLWSCIENAEAENRKLRIQNNKLEDEIIQQRAEIGQLRMELDRDPPAWKSLKTGDQELISFQRLAIVELPCTRFSDGRTNDEAIQTARSEVVWKLAYEAAKKCVNIKIENDTAGKVRVVGTLQAMKTKEAGNG